MKVLGRRISIHAKWFVMAAKFVRLQILVEILMFSESFKLVELVDFVRSFARP